MKQHNKKAFTVIELVIVIAVIGILSAILIPTFISLTSQSKKAATEALITNLNKILMIDEVNPTSISNITLGDALADVSDNGYSASGIANNDTLVLWDQVTNRFIKEEDIPSNRNKYEYWCISSTPSNTYSTYLLPTSEDITTSYGIDAGTNENLSILFNNSAELSDIRIRTNKSNLEIKANDNSKIYQYGSSNTLAMNDGNLYLYGTVDVLECNTEDSAIHSYGSIDHILMNDIDANINIYNDKLDALAYTFYDGVEPSNISGVDANKIYHYYHVVNNIATLTTACSHDSYVLFNNDIFNTNADHAGDDKNVYIRDKVFVNGNGYRFSTSDCGRLFGVETDEKIIIKRLILESNGASIHDSRGISIWYNGADITMDNVTFNVEGPCIYGSEDFVNGEINVTNSTLKGLYMVALQNSNNTVFIANSSLELYYSEVATDYLGYVCFAHNTSENVSNNTITFTNTIFKTSHDVGAHDNTIGIVVYEKIKPFINSDVVFSSNTIKIDYNPITDTRYPDINAYQTNKVDVPSEVIGSSNVVKINSDSHYYGE